jgi:hypothetical protein
MTFEVLTVIVFLNVIATISLWHAAARKPDKLKKKFLSKLRDSKPISPKHRPPKNIGDDAFPSLATREDRLFFDDFRDFADVVNWWLGDEHVGGPWRLQELPDTELRLSLGDSRPSFGRRYDIFYNQVPVGTLESIVAVRAPLPRFASVPSAPSVSAKAMMAPPCSTAGCKAHLEPSSHQQSYPIRH